MGYRIDYSPAVPAKHTQRPRPLRLQILCAACFLLFVLTVRFCWPAGTRYLRQFLLPAKDPGNAMQAFHEFVDDLESGVSFPDSVTAFCRDVIENANIGK